MLHPPEVQPEIKMADVLPETHAAQITDLEQFPATKIPQLHPDCPRPSAR
jgi:hypothetical protein